jgi:hypothetical protein
MIHYIPTALCTWFGIIPWGAKPKFGHAQPFYQPLMFLARKKIVQHPGEQMGGLKVLLRIS